jgi:hypothetical protein
MPEIQLADLGELSCRFNNTEKVGTVGMVKTGSDRVYTCDLDLSSHSEDLLLSRGLNLFVVSNTVENT